jgi:hypothetical protein
MPTGFDVSQLDYALSTAPPICQSKSLGPSLRSHAGNYGNGAMQSSSGQSRLQYSPYLVLVDVKPSNGMSGCQGRKGRL